MKQENIIHRAFNGIVIFIIVLVFAAASIIVFRSFQRSVEADIFLYTRDLEEKVKHIAAAEYRRYFLLADFGETFNFNGTEEDFRIAIEARADIFSPEGGLSMLVTSIGYFNNEDPGEAFEYELEIKSWQQVENIFNKRKITRDFDIIYSGSDKENGDMYLIIDRNGTNGLFLKLDSKGFIETYIKENVEALDSGLIFKWSESENRFAEGRGDNPAGIEPGEYSFKPFRLLLGIVDDRIPLKVEIPSFIAARILNEEDTLKRDRPPFVHTGIYAEILDTEGSFFHKIEHKAAVNFIETLSILLIIGVLFYLLLSQLQKTRQLRRKEREFVASVTHELRTPLTVIRSAADNLSTGIVPDDKLKIYGGLIQEQSDRLGKMIEEILLYSKFEDKRKINETAENTDLNALIESLRPGLEYVAEAENIRLHWDTSGLPGTMRTFPEVITLILNNLVTNAVNHAYTEPRPEVADPEKLPEIRVRIRYLITGRLMFEIEDDGRGIDSRELKHIFDPFYRDSVSRHRQEKGSGLGLFIAARKAALAGGKLTAESPYRRIDGRRLHGCRFTLILPCFLPEENTDGC